MLWSYIQRSRTIKFWAAVKPTIYKVSRTVKMSSTLFGRGINTQTGGRRKAEEASRDIEVLKTQISQLFGEVTGLKQTVAVLQKTVNEPGSSVKAASGGSHVPEAGS
jgi:hypothetical protein